MRARNVDPAAHQEGMKLSEISEPPRCIGQPVAVDVARLRWFGAMRVDFGRFMESYKQKDGWSDS